MFNKNYKSLGIDIGEKSISFVELHKKFNKFKIKSLGYYEISDIKDTLKIFAKNLQEKKISCKYVYITIPSNFVIKKTISFDCELKLKDIIYELKNNSKKYFNGIKDKLVFDFIKSNSNNLHIFGIKKSKLNQYKTILKKAGLKPISIETDNYALLRSVLFIENIKLNQNQAAIIIANNLRFLIFNNTEILHEQTYQNDNFDFSKTLQNFQSSFPNYDLEKIYSINQKSNATKNATIINPFNLNLKNELLCALGAALRRFYYD